MLLYLLCLACLGSVAHAADNPVRYHVRLPDPQTQTVHIDATFPSIADDELIVHLPVWRPGLYLVLDNAGSVRRVTAHGPTNEPLDIRKGRKSSWIVDLSPLGSGSHDVTIAMEIYANSIANRTRHVDSTHAFLSGSSVFLFSEATRDAPVRVTFERPSFGADEPEKWRLATGMAQPEPLTAETRSYDILIDSPVEFGLHERVDFNVDGVPHAHVIWGRYDGDSEQLAEDTAAIVRVQREIFGKLPYERYEILTHSAPGLRGGTEHYNSTVLSVDPAMWTDEDRYERFLSLVAHEVFHTWNIKRFRPTELDRYEYLEETYTKLLWLVEGTTSYYDDLTLPRAGVVDGDRYLEILSNSIDGYRTTPGRMVQPLDESSFDAWIKLFHRGADRSPDRANSQISFYLKGALVSFVLDMEIRSATRNAHSLDDVMRRLYEQFPLGEGGYTRADLTRIIRAVAPGVDVDAFFRDSIEGLAEVDFERAAAVAGLELVSPAIDAKSTSEEDNDNADPPTRLYTGLSVNGDHTVTRAVSNGPGYAAGCIVGDEILAVNGQRVGGRSTGSFADLIDAAEPGVPVEVLLSRRDELRAITFMPIERPDGAWTLKRVEEPTREQRAVYESWLGVDWPSDDDDEESSDDD